MTDTAPAAPSPAVWNGIPLDPHKDGLHVLLRALEDENDTRTQAQRMMLAFWHASSQQWEDETSPEEAADTSVIEGYVGPYTPPDEVLLLRAQLAVAEQNAAKMQAAIDDACTTIEEATGRKGA